MEKPATSASSIDQAQKAPRLIGVELAKGTEFVLVCPCCFVLMGEARAIPVGVDAINFYLQAEAHREAYTNADHVPDVVGVNDRSIKPYTSLFSPIQETTLL
jgi:hypothetical protein